MKNTLEECDNMVTFDDDDDDDDDEDDDDDNDDDDTVDRGNKRGAEEHPGEA